MKRIILFAFLVVLFTAVKAQVPQQLNYQGIARNASGNPITFQDITVRISIIDDATGGQTVYQETRRVRTNYVGLFNIVIGSAGATNVVGTMESVNWSTGQKSLKLEIDPNGANNYSLAGITPLQSVPYALSASPAGNASGDLTGTYPAPIIAANAITTNKIADGSINLTKLAPDVMSSISNKLNISDTAAMLAPYAGAVNIAASLATKLNLSDTANMLNPYYKSSTAVSDLATKEDVTNKSTDITTDGTSDTKYPSVKSVKDYVDASSTGSSAALTAEVNRATNAENTFTTNLNTEVTDRTNADATITTNLNNEVTRATNAEATKEDVANKSTDVTTDGTSDTKYPSVKSVKDYVDASSTGIQQL